MIDILTHTIRLFEKKHGIHFILFTLFVSFLLNAQHNLDQEPLVINMEEAEIIGISNSVILASLKDRRQVFKMVATEKWRNYLPRLGISYFGLRNTNVNQPDSQYNDIRLQLNQLIYDGGENALEIESAKLQELLNQEDWKIAREKITLEIRKAYIKLLASDIKWYVAEKAYERALRQLADLSKENKQGFTTKIQEVELNAKIKELELGVLKSKSLRTLNEIELKKQINLPIEVPIILKDSLLKDYVFYSPVFESDEESFALENKPEIKKSKLTIENLKTRKEIAENGWKPKLSVGGYYGENVNGVLPVKNEVYGFNFSVQTQLGSTTNQSSANYGVQTDGTGIQRIPGFGPQFVGRGENAYNSSTFNLFDDLSYTRKIYEGKIGLSDAIRTNKLIKINIQAEAFKSKEKFKESWSALSVSNSKFYLFYELWKNVQNNYSQGFAKETELVSAEFEMIKAVEEITNALSNYLESGAEYSFAIGKPMQEVRFFEIKRNCGNSILRLLDGSSEIDSRENDSETEESKKNKKSNKGKKGKEYQFFLEE
ncbi:channel protein TolC [Leptospira levettii]|uniref:TolC family protein n=1 Tax=Leptospira levettii TaxID=2023178 RepID=UPI0010830C9C|nr:TolC family protein [Leptospira levettii]TGL25330.1 channel protein TolC [Leptospira levettii]